MHGGACLRGILSWGRRRTVQSCKEAAHGAGYWLYKSSVGLKSVQSLTACSRGGVQVLCAGVQGSELPHGGQACRRVFRLFGTARRCVCNILHRRMQQAGRACGLAARRLPRRLPKVLEMHAARAFFEVFADCTDVLIGTMMS